TSTPSSTVCTVTKYAEFAGCLKSTNIVIQGPILVPNETLVDYSNLLPGSNVKVNGEVTWSHSTSFNKSYFLFTLGGDQITFDGSEGRFNGNGQEYWDGLGANGGLPKPKFFRVKATNSLIKGITIKNSPIHIFSIAGNNNTLDGIQVDNTDGDPVNGQQVGHNTDAFDVSATNITIKNSYIRNQDDCMAVNKGGDIHFFNNTCIGGHGISIGSISTGATVDGVFVDNCTIANSENGVRIKTVVNATNGYVRNIHYSNVILDAITIYGIDIQQDYLNGGPIGVPTGGIPVSNVFLTNISGTITSDAKYSVYILCADGACSNFTFTGINV
ncbi:polygalacturonase, partial [Zopfochytrium polystomum]